MLYEVVHSVLPPLAKAVWRPHVEGLENIPASGAVIVASNHLSFADSMVIPIVVPRRVAFLAKQDYFTGTGVKGALVRGWFEGIGMVPVDREDTRSALNSLDIALDLLARGLAFGIYPEGARSRDGRLYRGHTGVAHLALTSGAPIVPVGIVGTEKLQPIGATVPRLERVTLRFGVPIAAGKRFDGVPSGRARRMLTDEVMTAIQGLTGQDCATGYNDRQRVPGENTASPQ